MSSIPEDIWLLAGQSLAQAPPGEDLVITGISGCFPESRNVYEFRDNLSSKAEMVTNDTRRWDSSHPEIPKKSGKIHDVEKCDAGFFGIHQLQCHTLDPLCRILLEKSFECLLDAGINPRELQNTNTGVFVGACASETEKYWLYDKQKKDSCAITGCHRSMLASRVSYALKLQGPAFVMDTACSSSFFAFEHAYRALREGRCDRALVAGVNLCLQPFVTLQFSRLGVLSPDGTCKCFDETANGYSRSEAICAILIQKSAEAKRIYAQIVHCKSNSDGYKLQGITYPSGDTQKNLIKEVYLESEVNPSEISYIEAHGTGTKVGDPEELQAIDEIFLKGRSRNLLIGSVKSNIGHTEPTSGLCSITKVVLSMEGGKILPNVNFKTPRKGVKALENGKLKVVTDNTSWPDDNGLVGVSSFGFGGANCHAILKWLPQVKKSGNLGNFAAGEVLVLAMGRTLESVSAILQSAREHFCDAEFIRLLHEITRYDIQNFNYRSYGILNSKGLLQQNFDYVPIGKKELCFIFGGYSSGWIENFASLMQFKRFRKSISFIGKLLLKKNINFEEIIKNFDSSNKLHQILITFSSQISLYELLIDLNLVPVQIFGQSLGELTASFIKQRPPLAEFLEEILKLQIFPKTTKIQDSNYTIVDFYSTSCIERPQIRFQGNLLTLLGGIFLKGFNFDLHKFYPPIKWPVSRGTPMISPAIKWDHSKDWFVTKYRIQDIIKTGYMFTVITLKDEFWKFLWGHNADGRNLFPGTGYLLLAWEVLSMITGRMADKMQIMFENVRFLRAATIPIKGGLKWTVMVQRGSGYFEIIEDNTALATGFIKEIFEENLIEESNLPIPEFDDVRMTQKDIYSELKLRGYQYKGSFKSLEDVDLTTNFGYVKWNGNWVTFLDGMLQMQILQIDSRALYIPTGIKRLVIDPKYHFSCVSADGRIPIYSYKSQYVLRSGGVEIRGVMANSINRRKPPIAVLEKHIFVPNETTNQFTNLEICRIIIQICLENFPITKLKVIELLDASNASSGCFAELILESLQDLPLIEFDVRVFCNESIKCNLVTVEAKSISQEIDCYLIVGRNFAEEDFQQLKASLKVGGYILNVTDNPNCQNFTGFTKLCRHNNESTTLSLYKMSRNFGESHFVKVTSDLQFLDDLKTFENCILYSDSDTGILGLTNCLRKETPTLQTRCLMICDDLTFDPRAHFFQEQIAKNLAINILKNNTWGTYRHINIPLDHEITSEHCYVNVETKGDLSSLKWFQSPINSQNCDSLVSIYYASINFRDVMMASGKVSVEAVTMDRLEQECVCGFEFAGFDKAGRRVMGMLPSGAMASTVIPDPDMITEIPSYWSLEEAATVPVVYGTVLYAFFMRANGLQKGDKVLIHCGSGGVGQAAISVCLHYNCEVFTTVSSAKKKKFLLERFPKLSEDHIGHSRDTTFENFVMKKTVTGVDYILNSLAEEKLQASVRTLAVGGQFMEIGKFDLALDNELKLDLLKKQATFHGIMVDIFFKKPPSVKRQLLNLIINGIKEGFVVPLNRTVFNYQQLEEAFRFMSSGQHIGKIILKVHEEQTSFKCVPKFYCASSKSCMVAGGLGGFGLELCDWLVLRGCRNLFISSRNGLKSSYQKYRIQIWKSYGTAVTVIKDSLTDIQNCEKLFQNLSDLFAVFNLAVVLQDNLFEKQTKEAFEEVIRNKALVTENLDICTRKFCSDLQHFVVFSSVSCGRGNIAQSNYGMANSQMERLCEKRQRDGLPSLAIQWGSIADVGLAAEMLDDSERPIGGTLPQRISDCLNTLDKFLSQKEFCVVSSMVVAEKRGFYGLSENVVDAVASILGVRDLKLVSHHSSLPELGMDSMMAVEIKQTLERDYDVFLAPREIRSLTFAKLNDIKNSKDDVKPLETKHAKHLFRLIEEESISKIACVELSSLQTSKPNVFLIPGIEGFASILGNLASKLKFNCRGLQFIYENPPDNFQEMAAALLPHVNPKNDFRIIAFSYGCTVAVELVLLLEQMGHQGLLILIDGSYDMMLKLTHQQTNTNSDAEFETSILCNILSGYMPLEFTQSIKDDLLAMDNFEERVDYVLARSQNLKFSPGYIRKISFAIYRRIKAILNQKGSDSKIRSDVHLFKPTIQSVLELGDDYGLNKRTMRPVATKTFEADHYNILESDAVAQEVNSLILEGKISKSLNVSLTTVNENEIAIKQR